MAFPPLCLPLKSRCRPVLSGKPCYERKTKGASCLRGELGFIIISTTQSAFRGIGVIRGAVEVRGAEQDAGQVQSICHSCRT